MSKFASKKWISFLLVLFSGIGLCIATKISGAEFVTLVSIVAPLYFGADHMDKRFCKGDDNA